MPPGAAENFYREWLAPPPGSPVVVLFPFTSRTVAGSSPPVSVTVVETREHYELTTGLPPGAFPVLNEWLVVPINSAVFADGTYRFRVVGWTYAEALATGATAPVWKGGRMRLTVNAAEAFAGPCCFQIKLTAWSRTVVSCDGHLDYYNYSQFAIGVGVCPPRLAADALERGGAS